MKYLVVKDFYFLMKTAFPHFNWPTSWNGLISLVEKCLHDIKITPVLWHKPPDDWIKLNADGSALGDGEIGVGGIMRNKEGNFLLAYSSDGTSN